MRWIILSLSLLLLIINTSRQNEFEKLHDELIQEKLEDNVHELDINDRSIELSFIKEDKISWFEIYGNEGEEVLVQVSAFQIEWSKCPIKVIIDEKVLCLNETTSIFKNSLTIRIDSNKFDSPTIIEFKHKNIENPIEHKEKPQEKKEDQIEHKETEKLQEKKEDQIEHKETEKLQEKKENPIEHKEKPQEKKEDQIELKETEKLQEKKEDEDLEIKLHDSFIKANLEQSVSQLFISMNNKEDFIFEPFDNNGRAIFYSITSLDHFELELKFNVSQMDLKKCPFAILSHEKTFCVTEMVNYFDVGLTLRVNQSALSDLAQVQIRSVINGCGPNRTRSLQITNKLPSIVYNNIGECRLVIDLPKSNMLAVEIKKFNSEDKNCANYVKLSGRMDHNRESTNETIALFCDGLKNNNYKPQIYVRNDYAIIDLKSIDGESIELNVEALRSCGETFLFSSQSPAMVIESEALMSRQFDRACTWTFQGNGSNNIFKLSLNRYETDEEGSLISVYDLTSNHLTMQKFDRPKWMSIDTMEIANDEVTVQFERDMNKKPVDQFKMTIEKHNLKRYNFVYKNPSGYVLSINYPLPYFENSITNYEIQAPIGNRIILTLEKFNTGCLDHQCLTCHDEFTIQTEDNLTLCGYKEKPLKFYSPSNIMKFTFKTKSKAKFISRFAGFMGFRFKYESIPICNQTYLDTSDLIVFDSAKSNVGNGECRNTIATTRNDSQILMYPIRWNVENEEKQTRIMTNSLIIRETYFKSNSNNSMRTTSYSRNNQRISSLLSENGLIEITNRLIDLNLSQLSFQIGFFTYKSKFTKLNDEFIIDLSRLIHFGAHSSPINVLEYKISLPEDFFITPLEISNCKFDFSNGRLLIRTQNEIIELNQRQCSDKTLNLLTEMTNQVTIQILDATIDELRDNLGLKIKYGSSERVLRSPRSTVESVDFKGSQLGKNVNQTWSINIDNDSYVKLIIKNVTKCEDIRELFIKDSLGRIMYNKNQICQNYEASRNIYTFGSNRISVTLIYLQNSEKNPSIRFEYESEKRILTQPHEFILGHTNSLDNRNWLIQAPINHVIILDIKKLAKTNLNGQLRFSHLGKAYSQKGVYFYLLNTQPTDDTLDRDTDFVVSESNLMRVEYMPGGYDEHVSLSYLFEPQITEKSSGFIKPFIGKSSPIIQVAKITDQKWKIKAPYGKKIEFFISFVDLPFETPCSTAKVNLIESNGDVLSTLCGPHVKSTIVSKSSEVAVQFTTQNSLGAVYDELFDGTIIPYKGFKILYSVVNEPGDCYFNRKTDSLCGYHNIGEEPWFLRDESTFSDSEYSESYCDECHLELNIQPQLSPQATGRLMSPIISPKRKSLKFTYKLISGRMSVSTVPVNQPLNGVSLPLHLLETDDWIVAQTSIAQKYPFRLVFEFVRLNNSLGEPHAALDDIELFDADLTCSDHDWFFSHECVNRIKTKECAKSFDLCTQNPCLNSGICLNNPAENKYSCECQKGFYGVHCENRVNWCSIDNKCSKNSKCKNRANDYECVCNADYYGHYCEHKYDPCRTLENPCNQLRSHGECVDGLGAGNYSCLCDPSYTGSECEIKSNSNCLVNDCNKFDKNAKCFDTVDNFVCKCSSGFGGALCEPINNCLNVTCLNGGTCLDDINSFACKCTSDYEGKFCERAKLCDLCKLNGTLHCDSATKKCQCYSGFTGHFCETKIDHCTKNPCKNGECINKPNGFECICHEGFKGLLCNEAKTVCDSRPCSNLGSCLLGSKSNDFNCSCQPGYTGPHCAQVINQCESSPCKNGATCYPELNGFSCACREDYTGPTCDRKINNCDNSKCIDSTCIDLIGGYKCLCPHGRYGRYCQYVEDVCLNHACVHGECRAGHHAGNAYTCECAPGYAGIYCENEIDECSSNPCLNNGTCIDLENDFKCKCLPQYRGKHCEHYIHYCSLVKYNTSNTILCNEYPGGYHTSCQPGFTGPLCDIQIHPCNSTHSPCHTGECVKIDDQNYTCINCLSGYTGKNCSELIDYCASTPCKFNGTCLPKVNGYYCECKTKHSGTNCELDEHHVCTNNKCLNGATCVASGHSYKCECADNYHGQYCELIKNKCDKVDCAYGYCVDGKCVCDPKLPFCTETSKCHEIECKNGGTCVDTLNGNSVTSKCMCPSGTTGEFCEESLYCHQNACGDLGTCRSVNGSYECDCKEPFIGPGCLRKVSEYLALYEQQLRMQKLQKMKDDCRFGYSRKSQLFIGFVGICLLIFSLFSFCIGSCVVSINKRKYTKRYKVFDAHSSPLKIMSNNNSSLNETIVTYPAKANGITIPRPYVRIQKK